MSQGPGSSTLEERESLLRLWQEWENELPQLQTITLPRCSTSDVPACNPFDLHIFSDASERAYGSVAYLRVKRNKGRVKVAFVMARSRVAPKKQLSITHLELCAALSGTQIVKILQTELTLPITNLILWTDSTTVLHWIQSESQLYKVCKCLFRSLSVMTAGNTPLLKRTLMMISPRDNLYRI